MNLSFLDDPLIRESMEESASLLGAEAGGGLSDVFGEDSFSSLVVFEDQRVEAASLRDDRGVGLRLTQGGRTLSAALADPGPKTILSGAKGLLDKNSPSTYSRSAKRADSRPPSLLDQTPMGLERMVELCRRIDLAARGLDSRVSQVRVVLREHQRRIGIFRPGAAAAFDNQGGIFLSVQVIAGEGTLVQTGYEAMGGSLGEALFDEEPPLEMGLMAAKRSLTMLGARVAPLGPMCVVLAAEAGGTMIHEAIGHGLEADLVGEGHSVYRGMEGRKIASELVTVIDDPTLLGKRGSYRFDDEGELARRNVLVDKGVLKGWLHSRETALKEGALPSGNGRRETFRHPPIPRMSNTMIAPGFTDPAEIIRATQSGIYVTRMGGGQVDTVSGDFVFEVSEGFLIENGEVGEPLRGATIAGNGPEALKSIDLVGSDLGFGVGTCGKDGQGAPVSDAQPTLRIPELIVGGCSP